jgi:hypothetical protein
MAEFLLVVEGLMADGADAAMFVSEDTYKGAMFGCVFAEPVHGYVWCDRHGWVRSDEACVCNDCIQERMEKAFLEGLQTPPFEWTEEALDEAMSHMAEVEERAWLQTERAAEWAVQQFVSQRLRTDPPRPRETVEQQVRRAVFDMAKGKDVSRIFR